MRPENNGSEAGTTRPTSQSPPSHKNETGVSTEYIFL